MLCFISKKENFYTKEKHTRIFKSVADLTAIAVAGILTNRELVEREKEKDLLYKIASTIANVKNRVSLMKLIFEELKNIFQFYDVGLLVFDKDRTTGTDWSTLSPEISPSDANHAIHSHQFYKLPVKGSLFEKLAKQVEQNGEPIIVKFNQQLQEENPDLKHLLELELKFGYKEALFTTLKYGNEVIGSINLNSVREGFFHNGQFKLFQAVADLIATAVANILASEEIISLNNQLKAQNEYLIEEVEGAYNFEEMIGQNPKFSDVCRNISLVAKTESTVLILGETGTGKELVARAIHNNSTRKSKPLIKLNCAALPASLIESELFGHERGAFTGAIDRRIGKFELANGSTLFLDEVGEMPLELQAKLLRALQEREIERLGSNKTISIDVRIIAATNRELIRDVQAGKFRQDLYYRLHIFPIMLPPLRERKEDIPLLASHFIKKYAKKSGKNIEGLSHKAMQEMMSYSWPGNIRELEHVIERSTILCKFRMIPQLDLPVTLKTEVSTSPKNMAIKTWQEQERDYILEVLKFTNGKVKGKGSASELLQLPATTLQSKMDKLGIKRTHIKPADE